MKNKRNRLQIISEILRSKVVGSQEELLNLLIERECDVTQATLSRDLKLLKVAKTPLSNGLYKYVLPVCISRLKVVFLLPLIILNRAKELLAI